MARRFFATVAEGDVDKLAEMTQVPFSVGNGVVLATSTERDEFFRNATTNWKKDTRPASLSFLHTARGDEFIRLSSGDEARVLRAIPAHELRAVHVRLRRGADHDENGAVLIRVTDHGVRVVGLGYTAPRPPGQK
jgi:hypothetical protein